MSGPSRSAGAQQVSRCLTGKKPHVSPKQIEAPRIAEAGVFVEDSAFLSNNIALNLGARFEETYVTSTGLGSTSGTSR